MLGIVGYIRLDYLQGVIGSIAKGVLATETGWITGSTYVGD